MADDLTHRALAAYFRSPPEGLMQPAMALSGETKHGGLRYVVLRNTRGVLAVYRVRNDGMLKRLKRWPNDLE